MGESSPLSGGYLLIVLAEPHSEQHKEILLQRLAKGEPLYFLIPQGFGDIIVVRNRSLCNYPFWKDSEGSI